MGNESRHPGLSTETCEAIYDFILKKLETMSETEIRDKIKNGIENIEIKDTVD